MKQKQPKESERGELVRVVDCSGAFLVETGQPLYGNQMIYRNWRIVDFAPMKEPHPMYGLPAYENDCVIQADDVSRQRVSIQSRFLRPLVKHCCTCRCDAALTDDMKERHRNFIRMGI